MKYTLSIIITLIAFNLFAQKEMYDICPIKNSEEVPAVIVYNKNGKEINLKEYINKKPTILVFYRGAWCPYCMRQLSFLQEIKSQIDSLGFELIAITPDDFKNLDSSIIKGNDFGYQLFSDKDINAIDAFGIGWKINDELYLKYKEEYKMDVEWWTGNKKHILPVPSVFIIQNGKIEYQYVNPNYSKRLSPKVLLSILNSLN